MKILRLVLIGGAFLFYFWIIDVHGVQALWKQHHAEAFPHTEGKVLTSRVTITRGSKGRIYYHVAIAYSYSVDGQEYVGRRFRYDGHPTNENSANAVVSAHPAGSEVNVFYNPQDPRDSVLSPGVDTPDVSNLFLFTPFSLYFLWLMVRLARQIDLGSDTVAGGVKLISEMMATRVRLPRIQPLTLGLLALGALLLVAGILMTSGTISGPPLTVGGRLLACVLLGGAMAYAWQYRKIQSGRQDLVIDEAGRTIKLPLTYKRRTQTPMPFSEIQAVALKEVWNRRKIVAYIVTLEMKDGSIQNLINLPVKRAQTFAAWLRDKFGLTEVAPVN